MNRFSKSIFVVVLFFGGYCSLKPRSSPKRLNPLQQEHFRYMSVMVICLLLPIRRRLLRFSRRSGNKRESQSKLILVRKKRSLSI